ncbi:MAG: WYL domain-containing protein [Candidatus Omnitrophica bacterium]|nr:WYL domain-containing protein [Candidatus Omnitrophota bacterium]
MLIKSAEFVVFDVETTGLNPEQGDKICEIGAVKVKDLKITSSFNSLVNPQRDIPQQASAIHGIVQGDVAACPSFEEIIDGFLEFIEDLPIFAYNIGFDLSFLNPQLKSANREPLVNPPVDILIICRTLLKDLARFNLSSVARFFNIPQDTSHRAKQDSQVAADVFVKMVPYLEEKGILTLENIYTVFGANKGLSFKINNSKISLIQEALAEGTKLRIRYYSLYKNELTEREVLPLRIENAGYKISLVARCFLREEERSFNLDRVVDLEIV